jgi:hypothetical protein
MTVSVFNPTTADGRLRNSNATYLTARSGGGTFATDTTATFAEVGQELSGGIYYCYESFFDFDTSIIPVGATIASATLEGYVVSVSTGSSTAAIVRARIKDWGASITTADWVAGASLSGQTLVAHMAALSGLTVSAYNTFVNDALAANINKGGVTRIMLHTDRLEAGTAPGVGGEYATIGTAESGNPMKLTVDWSLPAGVTLTPDPVKLYFQTPVVEGIDGQSHHYHRRRLLLRH